MPAAARPRIGLGERRPRRGDRASPAAPDRRLRVGAQPVQRSLSLAVEVEAAVARDPVQHLREAVAVAPQEVPGIERGDERARRGIEVLFMVVSGHEGPAVWPVGNLVPSSTAGRSDRRCPVVAGAYATRRSSGSASACARAHDAARRSADRSLRRPDRAGSITAKNPMYGRSGSSTLSRDSTARIWSSMTVVRGVRRRSCARSSAQRSTRRAEFVAAQQTGRVPEPLEWPRRRRGPDRQEFPARVRGEGGFRFEFHDGLRQGFRVVRGSSSRRSGCL